MWWGLGCLLFGFFVGFLYAAIFRSGDPIPEQVTVKCPECGEIVEFWR